MVFGVLGPWFLFCFQEDQNKAGMNSEIHKEFTKCGVIYFSKCLEEQQGHFHGKLESIEEEEFSNVLQKATKTACQRDEPTPVIFRTFAEQVSTTCLVTQEKATKHSKQVDRFKLATSLQQHSSFRLSNVKQGSHTFWNQLKFPMQTVTLIYWVFTCASWCAGHKKSMSVESWTSEIIELVFL